MKKLTPENQTLLERIQEILPRFKEQLAWEAKEETRKNRENALNDCRDRV